MAISPKEAAELSDNERAILAKIEAEIDEYLRESPIRREYMPINIPFEKSYCARIIAAIIDRYNRVGWYVETNFEGRKSHLVFDLSSESRRIFEAEESK